MIHLTLDDVLHVAERTVGDVALRDAGLLAVAVARPAASAFGADAYPTIAEKAAALLHALATNRALVDGNKRLALAATLAFLGINGVRLRLTNDAAYDLVVAVASGALTDVPAIAARLRTGPARR